MSLSNFRKCLNFTLAPDNDGQPFHCDVNDHGGDTAYGVTLETFKSFYGDQSTLNDLENITELQIEHIYMSYFMKCRCDVMMPGVDLMVFDFAVNAGTTRSIKIMQQTVGVVDDGIVGPKTLTALNAISSDTAIHSLYNAQLEFYRDLKQYPIFGHGWTRRLNDKLKLALEMSDSSNSVS